MNTTTRMTLEAILIAVDGVLRDHPEDAYPLIDSLEVELLARKQELSDAENECT